MDKDINFRFTRPAAPLDSFVESFWLLHNRSAKDKEIVVLPDGRADLILSRSPAIPFHITLSGIETYPETVILPAGTMMFAISFKLPALEYLFPDTISALLNYAQQLPARFWDFTAKDLRDFDLFCKKATHRILSLLPANPDARKLRLFDLVYSSNGALTVAELAKNVYWTSRQINRYFNTQFGLSLKSYCTILRFRASLEHIAQGKLFPELNFSDQSHFIKAVKKFSGVSPKALQQNKNDRFIQFTALGMK